jgi:lipid II:glycine glycyltransferase (peptidoglycan interpeptide bridge formation enzyme)
MANDRLQLQLLISAAGAQRTAAEIRRIQEAIERNTQASRANSQQSVQGNNQISGGIAELAFRYNNVVGALQNLRATAQPVYDALIASNEKFYLGASITCHKIDGCDIYSANVECKDLSKG